MKSIDDLIDLVKQLRAPDGCPWDKEQTLQSLAPCIIEEAYELVDALESNHTEHITEELGDALLHVVMLCVIGNETQRFSLTDVATNVHEKMVRRHPHVFGDNTTIDSVDKVWSQWDKIKEHEKKHHEDTSIMANIPKLPALLRAEKIQKKASRVGFDWPDVAQTVEKLDEELAEFKAELTSNPNRERVEEEAGDMLFAFVNVLRKVGLNPEEALRKANSKFVKRFKQMELLDADFVNLSLTKKEALWEQAKERTS